MALGLTVFGRLAPAAPVPVEALSVLNVIETVPRLRGFVEDRIGVPAADVVLSISSAVSTSLAQGTTGLLIDGVSRLSAVSEIRARQRVCQRREPHLCATPWSSDAVPRDAPEQPVALPQGPIEGVGDQLPLAGTLAGGVVGAATLSPRRAAQLVLAGLPKAATLGREAFAAQLARALAARGTLVVDSGALRRLDRLDTVIVDARLLVGDRRLLGQPGTVDATAADQVIERLEQLPTHSTR